jgi:preprotein translocase subunit SecA
VANRAVWTERISRLQGSTVHFDLATYAPSIDAIAALEPKLQGLTDSEIRRRSRSLQDNARAGAELPALRTEVFALVREASRRVLGERPFDEQVVAGLALDDGRVVQMQTGEGKTLTAVMPAALNALTDRGVHVLTFNDYLARRDAEWMGPIYGLLGLSVAHVRQGMAPVARRAAYNANVTYVTATEAGFDHLRDLLVMNPGERVHRSLHVAVVDEADSLMIDEARVPLVIAGRIDSGHSRAPRLATLVASLSPGVHFDVDEYGRDVELTEGGVEFVEQTLGCGALHASDNIALFTDLNCALHARVLLKRDVDYIVRNGRIEIVDEFTGRVATDRHWPDGLQAALEAKEGLERRPDGRILGSMTLQRFLRGYPRLSGMTGTAQDAAVELRQFYGLDVVVIPTHLPTVRVDRSDLVFSHREAKDRAVVAEIQQAHQAGRPVLVGTATITESERLADRLRSSGIPCEVLNARNDAEEASIVARAGSVGAVTISTNMAGRGTDIRLGGPHEVDRERVVALGGLYVIGTNRHESRRVDLQLRGRAGRQGDPGESRFFVSLEDDLFVRYGIPGVIPSRFLQKIDDPLDSPIIRREVGRAQRIVDGQNFEVRRTLARYAAVVEQQHDALMERRRAVLTGEDLPGIWSGEPEPRAALVAAVGEQAVVDAERCVMLACIDQAWRDHLALCADVREGIHLVRLGGRDPLTTYTSEVIQAFSTINDAIDDAVLAALPNVRIVDSRIDLTSTGITAPSSTWTYLVNDDPFESRIGTLLTGPGRATLGIYSTAVLMPLLMLWAAIDRLLRRPGRRRSGPLGS